MGAYPYSPDDPAICNDSTPGIVTGCILVAVIIIGNVALFGDIIAFWYWTMISLFAGTSLLGLSMKIYDRIDRLMPIEYDTSNITRRDIQDFMCYKRTLDEVKCDNTLLAQKYLKSFIYETYLWEDSPNTDCHFIYDGVQLFIGHERIELKDHHSSDENKFNHQKIKIGEKGNLKVFYKKAKSKFNEIQRKRNGWVN